MQEIILNIYLNIENGFLTSLKAVSYKQSGSDEEKVNFLKEKAADDFFSAFVFDAPINEKGEYMPFKKFQKLIKQGKETAFFEEIFEKFEVPDQPLICVTPVIDGKVMAENRS